MPAPDGTCVARTHDPWVLNHGLLTTAPSVRTCNEWKSGNSEEDVIYTEALNGYHCYILVLRDYLQATV